jgi:hypothetical protein
MLNLHRAGEASKAITNEKSTTFLLVALIWLILWTKLNQLLQRAACDFDGHEGVSAIDIIFNREESDLARSLSANLSKVSAA